MMEPSEPQIRLLVVDRTRMDCELFAAALREEPEIRVIGYARSREEALEKAGEDGCNTVLVHTRLPNGDALRLLRALGETYPDINIVIAGLLDSNAAILRCAEEGAVGFVLEDDSPADLVKKVRAVHEGKSLVSPSVASALLQRMTELRQLAKELHAISLYQADELFAELTAREWDVLHLITKGYNNQQIADELVIEIGTTKNHVHSILSKLEVRSREQAALLARHMLSEQQDNASAPAKAMASLDMLDLMETRLMPNKANGNGKRHLALV